MSSDDLTSSPLAYFRSVLAEEKMQSVLQEIAKSGDIAVTCLLDGRITEFSDGANCSITSATRLEIGCIAKTLTSALFAIAVSESRLLVTDRVADYFPRSKPVDPSLRIFHLLNHSHGLDGSALWNAPISRRGFIDADLIWGAVEKAPTFGAPGDLFYNYGNAGFWLAAAILEAIYRTPYWAIMSCKLLRPMGIPHLEGELQNICPAIGGISLSARELLKICDMHLSRHADEGVKDAIAASFTHFVSVPSWPRIAHGSCPGWLKHGAAYGSFGYRQAVSTFMMLIWPGENAAIVIGADRLRPIFLAQQALFGTLFGSEKESPRPLTKAERSELQWDKFVGDYRKGNLHLNISYDREVGLKASLYRRLPEGGIDSTPFISRSLIPALENTLYPIPPEPSAISFIRLFRNAPDNGFLYATTGRHLFRRV